MKRISLWQMAGFVFTGILGTFLHFLFDISGENPVIAVFSAVNESIWEHLKLLFYPMLIFGIIEYFFWGKDLPRFWCVKGLGILFSLILTPVLYYTYTGIGGVNADWFNITIFFLAAGAGYYLETKWFQRGFAWGLPAWMAVGILLLMAAAFTIFTFQPLHIPFFADPQTGLYGYRSP